MALYQLTPFVEPLRWRSVTLTRALRNQSKTPVFGMFWNRIWILLMPSEVTYARSRSFQVRSPSVRRHCALTNQSAPSARLSSFQR